VTQVKTISIKDVELFEKLNQYTPGNMGFTQQVTCAVKFYVDQCEKAEGSPVDELPKFDAAIEEWIDYMNNHPEHIGNMMRRVVQLSNILRREEYAIQ